MVAEGGLYELELLKLDSVCIATQPFLSTCEDNRQIIGLDVRI
jgi:hypothetical protein